MVSLVLQWNSFQKLKKKKFFFDEDEKKRLNVVKIENFSKNMSSVGRYFLYHIRHITGIILAREISRK